ncbi:MAG: hypothetical protein FWC26_08930 [Fibromonadales bacterium]|nr:hypothetical protein [Fibromonadales bacterium]
MGKNFKAIASTTSCLFLLFFVILVSCSDYEYIDPYTREGAPTNSYSSSEELSSSSLGKISSSSEDILNSSSSITQSSSSELPSSSSSVIPSSSSSITQSSSSIALSSSSSIPSSSSVALCGSETYKPSIQFCDTRDKKLYKYVKINNVIWMAENLNYDVTNDATDVCYDNNPNNCTIYGRLYSFTTATANKFNPNGKGIQGVCPSEWHIPSESEWKTLRTQNDITDLRSPYYWSSLDGYVSGTDNTGFSALPGGELYNDKFSNLGEYGSWWSSGANIYMYINYKSNSNIMSISENAQFSVRCIHD